MVEVYLGYVYFNVLSILLANPLTHVSEIIYLLLQRAPPDEKRSRVVTLDRSKVDLELPWNYARVKQNRMQHRGPGKNQPCAPRRQPSCWHRWPNPAMRGCVDCAVRVCCSDCCHTPADSRPASQKKCCLRRTWCCRAWHKGEAREHLGEELCSREPFTLEMN